MAGLGQVYAARGESLRQFCKFESVGRKSAAHSASNRRLTSSHCVGERAVPPKGNGRKSRRSPALALRLPPVSVSPPLPRLLCLAAVASPPPRIQTACPARMTRRGRPIPSLLHQPVL